MRELWGSRTHSSSYGPSIGGARRDALRLRALHAQQSWNYLFVSPPLCRTILARHVFCSRYRMSRSTTKRLAMSALLGSVVGGWILVARARRRYSGLSE